MNMNEFLKKIARDMKINGREYSSLDFYYLLKYVGVKKDNSLVLDIEKFYEDFLNNLDNSLVKYDHRKVKSGDNATYYIGFYASKKASYMDAIKVYFPVKYEYLMSALKTVFLYLIRNNIKATVKFHVKATNEGIVIRFYNKEDALPFINYCNNNFILKDLLVSVHPFMATIYGLGLAQDDNTVNSYNGCVSDLLEEYFKLRMSDDSLEQVCDLDFLDFVNKRYEVEDNEIKKFNIKAVKNNITAILNHANPIG